MLYYAESTEVELFETTDEHSNHNSDPTRGLSDEVKNFVRAKFDENIHEPNALLHLIRQQQFAEPE